MKTIKTASELKQAVEQAGHDSYFFERDTMRFFGDTMSNYGVRSVTIKTNYDSQGEYVGANGVELEVYELYRRKPVKHGNQGSAYFDKETFQRVFESK